MKFNSILIIPLINQKWLKRVIPEFQAELSIYCSISGLTAVLRGLRSSPTPNASAAPSFFCTTTTLTTPIHNH